MESLVTQPVFQAYGLAVSAIVVMLYGLGFNTARIRNARKIVLNHEDSGINGNAKVAEDEHPDVLRIKRAHLNLIENAVPFFAMGFLYTFTNPSVNVARGLFAAFVVVRLFHVVFYLNAKQPFRTASFALGVFVNMFMLVQVVRTAFGA